jgi:ankyrin repeat protein
MARYDLMHWSQRVRDQQAAARAAQPAPSVLPTPAQQPAKPRASRRKPPRDEEAEQLLRLCREGRLFELQAWVAAGKSLSVPAHYRQTPMRVALGTGFHSLIEFLLRHEEGQPAKDDVLRQACWSGQRSVMQLALNHGASICGVSFQSVIETWDRGVAQRFLEHGADPVTNAPFARAFKARVKAALGIFLDCKRARPDLADALQLQADMALRQACQDEDLKWVSLLMWLGANPRAKGLATDDIDTPGALDDPEYRQSALQIACRSKEPKILKRLKPDPATDDLRELMAAAASLITTPETIAYLVSLGADINDKPDGGSTVLDTCLRNFGWRETVWETSYLTYRHSTVPASRLGKSLDALQFVLEKGARWTPDDRAIADTRRALYRVDGEGIAVVVELLRTHHACDDDILTALVRTEKMRGILAGVERRRLSAERRAKRVTSPAARRLPRR